MTIVVTDASVAAKWFVPESQWPDANRLLHAQHRLIAPELFASEIVNIMVKRFRRGELTRQEAERAVADTLGPVDLLVVSPLIEATTTLALDRGISAYDATYAALALHERCQLVTADRRLYDALSPHFAATMLWIEDIPAI